MARWKMMISGKGVRKASLEKLAKKFRSELGDEVSVGIQDDTPPESRADRFGWATGCIGDAKSEAESLKDELEQWYENLPENFQNGDKGQELQTAIDELDDFIGQCENLEGHSVDFPGMY